MNARLLRLLGGGVLALGTCAALAQVPDELRARLARDGVASSEAWFFASASGVVRGTREAEEDRQVTRAMRLLAQALCNFEPAPGKRLEASLKGLTMVSSTVNGRELQVVMRAPAQSPDCKVLVADPVVRATPAPVAAGPVPAAPGAAPTPAEREGASRPLEPATIREKNMTIRIHGGDY